MLCLLATVCIAPGPASMFENNTVGYIVTTIQIQENVSLNITENPYDAFGINGNSLVANKVLDYEVIIPITGVHSVILCNVKPITFYCDHSARI